MPQPSFRSAQMSPSQYTPGHPVEKLLPTLTPIPYKPIVDFLYMIHLLYFPPLGSYSLLLLTPEVRKITALW